MAIFLLVVVMFIGAGIAERGDKRQDPGLMIVGIIILLGGAIPLAWV